MMSSGATVHCVWFSMHWSVAESSPTLAQKYGWTVAHDVASFAMPPTEPNVRPVEYAPANVLKSECWNTQSKNECVAAIGPDVAPSNAIQSLCPPGGGAQ